MLFISAKWTNHVGRSFDFSTHVLIKYFLNNKVSYHAIILLVIKNKNPFVIIAWILSQSNLFKKIKYK